MTRNGHVRFGERSRETRSSRGEKVRSAPTLFSPLLANIALHGMEEALGIKHRKRGELDSTRALVRYADDFCVFCENQVDAQAVKDILTDWLSKRGLALSPEKTHIVHLTEGFNFLGFTSGSTEPRTPKLDGSC